MTRIEFALDGHPFVELHQAGEHLVASGVVRVDGEVELRKTCKIHAGQAVRVEDIEILVR